MTKGNKIDHKVSEEITKEEEWKPTPHMEKWLDTAMKTDGDSISDISEECKISRTAWYDWIKDDNFLLWYKQEWDKRIASEAWKLDKIGMKNAKRDHKYWQDMQRRVGNLKEEKGTTNNTFVIPILGPKTETIYVPQDNSDQQDPEA